MKEAAFQEETGDLRGGGLDTLTWARISWRWIKTHCRIPPLTTVWGRLGSRSVSNSRTHPREPRPGTQRCDKVSKRLSGLAQSQLGPQAFVRGVMSMHHVPRLELIVTLLSCVSLEHNDPLSLLCLHTQVFPPFRLIPRKVTLIIGATMQVGATG